jgi:uncharacterized protein (DUF433 family)
MSYNEVMNPISVDPEIMSGTPCFAGTRVPIKNLFDYLAHGHPMPEFLRQFPSVKPEQAQAVLDLAQQSLLKTTAA